MAALICLAVVFAALGVSAARLRRHRHADAAAERAAQAYRDARRAREDAGKATQSAISALFYGDDERAQADLADAAGQGGGYIAYLRLGLALRGGDLDAAPALLEASTRAWDVFTDALGMPGQASIERELTVFRRLTDDLCDSLSTGEVPGGAAGLERVRAVGAAAAGATPPDVVHLQLGAYMRTRADESLLRLARNAHSDGATAKYGQAVERDRAWQQAINRRTLDAVKSLPASGDLSESEWAAALRGEAATVQALLDDMPD